MEWYWRHGGCQFLKRSGFDQSSAKRPDPWHVLKPTVVCGVPTVGCDTFCLTNPLVYFPCELRVHRGQVTLAVCGLYGEHEKLPDNGL